ncbi:MAG: hypothetical protein A2504_16620 [Bdellovibrionales bacterium RIFOXYD12_FULL_39_22]|nr:MAG: hypothetical protein A2385_14475 [Bdellovibrionales bacterium RIFOXYB1_FULL_39_21]OFZ44997.1 MAG: hypothetical protein A2485_13900 [Bdellovibrionales bacterium RIFOXYC12_FULL_39_17]OFZ49435.1 MAG: hypothetical protein A2404_08385 [Bdellovibrionales bacterium RIFOXYC1_FULL_39_130]OFZ73386.1 MAG: hypothetical protein A2451_00860 [Bdellovibrionales bacterium RIFOXYC2_FULL_39_8]OFZ77174.1 MAG: hypothetical protein A2560_07910 [Bdellovibrionales bacterium RIFOXYD1_FULL_39_84]OFZ95619.1 MAG:
MKKLLVLIAYTSLLMLTSLASEQKLICSVERLNKAFHLKEHSVTFYDIEDQGGRAIASVSKIRTQRHASGITKVITYDNLKYSFHIENQDNFSSYDDYLAIHSKKGHEIIYPIECQWK